MRGRITGLSALDLIYHRLVILSIVDRYDRYPLIQEKSPLLFDQHTENTYSRVCASRYAKLAMLA